MESTSGNSMKKKLKSARKSLKIEEMLKKFERITKKKLKRRRQTEKIILKKRKNENHEEDVHTDDDDSNAGRISY